MGGLDHVMRRTEPLIAALLVVLLAASAPAGAAEHRRATPAEKAIWGSNTLGDGQSAFPSYQELGVDVLEIQLDWATTAPAKPADPGNPGDPAYRWPRSVDDAVAQSDAAGIQVAIMVRGTPPWANGGRSPAWTPTDPKDYGDFLVAAARRYPQVRRWMIWGEPTRAGNYHPMPANKKTGPRSYAKLLDAAYGALHWVDDDNIVIGGMTFTTGLVNPYRFLKWMRLPNGQPPRLDWYGHNAFSTRFPRLKDKVYVKGLRDINDLDTLHRQLRHVYRGHPTPPIWVSEFTISSDRPNRAFNFAVSRPEQAKWLAAAYKLVNSVDYVAGLGWFNLQDEVDDGSGRSLTTGLMAIDGVRKPAFTAFARAP
jgi:hypothetical protein